MVQLQKLKKIDEQSNFFLKIPCEALQMSESFTVIFYYIAITRSNSFFGYSANESFWLNTQIIFSIGDKKRTFCNRKYSWFS